MGESDSAPAWQPGKKAPYSRFAATCMHPQGAPNSQLTVCGPCLSTQGGCQSRHAGCRMGKNRKNMFQFTSRGMCAPMGSLLLWKGATMRTIQIQNNQWSLKHCPVLCIVHFAAPFAQKCDHLPSQISKSPHIPPPPPNGTKFWRSGPKVHKNQEKCQNSPCWRTTNVPKRYFYANCYHLHTMWMSQLPTGYIS